MPGRRPKAASPNRMVGWWRRSRTRLGTGLVFEDDGGVIRFVSMTGMKEGELARYDQTPTHGGIPKSYGRLVPAVVNSEGTGLVFEDSEGVIRFVTIAGK